MPFGLTLGQGRPTGAWSEPAACLGRQQLLRFSVSSVLSVVKKSDFSVELIPFKKNWCSSAYTLLFIGLRIKHKKKRIVSTNAHELARMKKVIFQPADRRQESFIPLSRG